MNVQKKLGRPAIAITCLVIAAFILLNILAGMLTDRFYLKADLQPTQLLSLSSVTTDLLRDMNQPVTLIFLANEVSARAQLAQYQFTDLLDKYAALSGGLVSVEYWDPALYPNLKTDFNLETVNTYDILVRGSNRHKLIPSDSFFSTTTDAYGYQVANGFQIERELSSAIHFVSAEKVPAVVFTNSHGEALSALAAYQDMFSSTGFQVVAQPLTQTLPEGTELVVIAAPATDFTAEEIAALDTFALNGGHVIYLVYNSVHANLEAWFNERGLGIQPEVILDPLNRMNYNQNIVPELAQNELFASLSSGVPLAMMPRALEPLFTERSGYQVSTLIQASSSAFARRLDSENVSEEKGPEDRSGPFPIVLQAEYTGTGAKTMIIPMGMAADNILASHSFQNNEILAAFNRNIYPAGTSLMIQPKTAQNTPMSLIGFASGLVSILLIGVLPLSLLIIGLVIWLRRRHL